MAHKILITEDSATILAIIQQDLEDAGFNVITAMDGLEAINRAREETPDLIVLDLMLPKMDGAKVCAMLKFDSKYKDIPIIMLTACAGESDREACDEAHADLYLTKPFEAEVLIKKIKELLVGK